jgi:alpha-mannosidase
MKSKSLSAVDCDNQPVPLVVRGDKIRERDHPWQARKIRDVEVEIFARNLPSTGYKAFYICEAKSKARDCRTDLRLLKNGMENQFYRISFNRNGSLNIQDKETGLALRNCHWFEDVADTGDEYDFCSLRDDRPITSQNLSQRDPFGRALVSLLEQTPFSITYIIKTNMRIPQALAANRKKRSRKFATLNIETRVTIFSQTKRVDFQTSLFNTAKDHRLRVVFPVPIKADLVDAESCFDVCKRPFMPEARTKWMQSPVATHHQANFASLSDATLGVTFINKGLPEYEVRKQPGGVRYYLTLLRAVGWLSRADLHTRPGGAGPLLETPDAQMPRLMNFSYSLTTHNGDWEVSRSDRAAYEHNYRPIAMALDYDPMRPEKRKSLPEEISIVEMEPDDLLLSAVKKAEDRPSLIVRCFNPLGKIRKARLRIYKQAQKAYLVNLNEERQGELNLKRNGQEVRFMIRAKEILSIEFVPK